MAGLFGAPERAKLSARSATRTHSPPTRQHDDRYGQQKRHRVTNRHPSRCSKEFCVMRRRFLVRVVLLVGAVAAAGEMGAASSAARRRMACTTLAITSLRFRPRAVAPGGSADRKSVV